MTWVRSPIYTGPRILNKESDQETIYLEATPQNLLLTTVVLDADNNIDTVVIDLTTLNGNSAQTMYDDGTHGDVTAGDGVYSFLATVPLAAGSGTKTLTVTATDSDAQSSQGDITVEATVDGEIVWDNGGANSNWSTPENWNPDGVPGAGDKVAFNNLSSADCVVDVSSIDVASLSLNYGYTGAVTLSAASMGSNALTITGDLSVNSGTLLCAGDTSAINEASGGTVEDPHGEGIIINAPSISVGVNGKISADAQGFLSNQGPGAGGFSHDQGAGGSYGGIGGDGVASGHGPTYGSVSAPTALGSAGAYNYSGIDTVGGTGAGAIKLVVSDTLTVDGTVSANGGNYTGGRAGGGSGGSVWIIAPTLAGSGSITADGGIGHAGEGGGGAGGRLALEWTTTTFNGTIRAKGGSGWQAGHHGTIWVPSDKWNELWNSAHHVKGSIALAPGDYTIAELYLDGDVTLECQADNDGDPVEGSGVTINADNITIPATAGISANGLGFVSNQGPGAGSYSHDQGAGGSHGGIGGDGVASGHGPTYGSISAPTSLGSGGAYNYGGLDNIGGTGAGATKLIVSDTLTVDGTISANGDRYFGSHAGGGAGGSVWLIANTLAGSGLISADGGMGESTEGGGGAGGRIALDWSNRTFNGTIRAKGGSGWQAGHHGTIWVPEDKWDELWNVDYHVNGSIALAPNSDADVPAEYSFLDLIIDSGVTLECQADNDGDPVEGSGVTINADNITIPATAGISANGLGFVSNQGPGAGGFSHDQGAGGSYGGIGGDGVASGHGPTYGSVSAPTSLGSGGAYNYGGLDNIGGTGAGAIKLVVGNTLTVDGTVSADGDRYFGSHAGGGAGGSVWIAVNILAGSGLISADGGMGQSTEGGGGAGGRIALDWSNRTFNGTIRAKGGSGWQAGHHGTIWVPSNRWNQLWDGTHHVNGSIALAPGDYSIAELHLDGDVTLECQADNDGDPVEGSGVTITATNITIPATAAISANGLGFVSNQGPGAGAYSQDQGAGGSHGGMGGDGVSAPAASTYGLASAPTSLGSGGAYNYAGIDNIGGTGGGAIKLVVSDTLTVDGAISADGDRYFGSHAGGGAGGSIWISVDTLTGASSGTITAEGGIGQSTEGGGGGGGRICINEANYGYSGTATVYGGAGVDYGEDGTIYYSASGDYDSDGMPDAWELPYGLNPSIDDSALDKDADGLDNIGEYLNGTNPTNPDTDEDGMPDGWELEYGLNPGMNDSTLDEDSDSLDNLGEYLNGADPTNPDTDGDGISDGWEVDHGLDPLADDQPKIWDNDSEDGDWSNAMNWSDDTLPAEGDIVVFNANGVDDCRGNEIADNLGHILLDFGYTGTLTIEQDSVNGGNTLTVTGDVTVSDGTIVCEADPTAIGSGTVEDPHGEGVIIRATNVAVGESGHISGDGQGFSENQGPGVGDSSSENNVGAGGGHGGNGGDGLDCLGGLTYGLEWQPTSLGSGGAAYASGGGSGGGAIKLEVTDTTTINGTVSANGTDYYQPCAGGGAGGSIWIVTDTIDGTGSITAVGGNGCASDGGGGSGGRICISTTTDTYTGTMSVPGGTGYDGGDEGTIREE